MASNVAEPRRAESGRKYKTDTHDNRISETKMKSGKK